MDRKLGVYLAVCVSLLLGSSAGAITAEEKCEADKNKIAGKYAFCRQKAEMKAIKKEEPADYTKCDSKLLLKWQKAEEKAVKKGTTCMDSVSGTDIQSFVTAHADSVAAALDGGDLPVCGDGSLNAFGEQCDGADLGGETCESLGSSSGTLACDGSCAFDTSGCYPGGEVATGQTTCDPGNGTLGACPGNPGAQDGEVQAGLAFSYTDNGDGTITDNNTGLMWEKLDDNNSDPLHDLDSTATWYDAYNKIDVLNGDSTSCFGAGDPAACCSGVGTGTCTGFAGHTDWRLANVRELQGIVSYGAASPSVAAAFNSGCAPGCTVDGVGGPMCSCTASSFHWSSTSYVFGPASAWLVRFNDGFVLNGVKTNPSQVRAVRGGS